MFMFLLALVLDATLIVFTLAAVHELYGWPGVVVVAFGSFTSHVLYIFARFDLHQRRLLARRREP